MEAFLGTNCYFQIILKHIKTRKLTICKSIILISLIIIFGCDKNISESNDSEINGWTKIKSGIASPLYDVDFVDEYNGWIVGDSGVILNTKNGGETWEKQLCPTDEILFALDFIDANCGWICSRNSILRTTNGGKSWEIKYSEDLGEGRFRDIQFFNLNTGFVVGGRGSFGSQGILYKTEDGGETWQDVVPQDITTLTHISIVDKQNIWICGFGGTILNTADLGLSWIHKNLNVSSPQYLTTVQFVDHYNGWVGADDDSWLGFFRTTDGGSTWIQRSSESWPVFLGVQTFFFIDALNGWLATIPGAGPYAILQTTDGGKTWKFLQEEMNVNDIKSFFFINKDLGWAVGLEAVNTKPEGVILRYGYIK